MLQAWALQHYLNALGHQNEIINLRPYEQRYMYAYPLTHTRGQLRKYLKSLTNPLWMLHECRRWTKFERFLEQNLQLTAQEYESWFDIVYELPKLGYDCLLTGGDQVWNMNCYDFSCAFYQPTPLNGIHKLSYASSFGDMLDGIRPSTETYITNHLSDFDNLAVRETSMQEFLSRLLHRHVDVVVDPTLLLEAADYEPLISSEPLIKEPYIFYYTPGNDFAMERLVAKIGRQWGLPVVTSYPRIWGKGGLVPVNEAGPSEFLNLVKNATLVVGKSFHLIAFSLLFHKDFYIINGHKDQRTNSLLSLLSLEQRGLINEENYSSMTPAPVDYTEVDARLAQWRKSSQDLLKRLLGGDATDASGGSAV